MNDKEHCNFFNKPEGLNSLNLGINTSALNLQQFFLHLHEIREGEGQYNDNQTYRYSCCTCG
jgi:hypothetical protein